MNILLYTLNFVLCTQIQEREISINSYHHTCLELNPKFLLAVSFLFPPSSSSSRVLRPRFPKADAFPGAPRPHPEEDDSQTEAAPGEKSVNNSTHAE